MSKINKHQNSSLEIKDLKNRLAEAEDTIDAIRSGAVDALVIAKPDGNKIFTLKSEDYTYRVLVEQMHEGALTFTPDGTILYANKRFAELLHISLEKLIGLSIFSFIAKDSLKDIRMLVKKGIKNKNGYGLEINIQTSENKKIPVYASLNFLQVYEIPALSMNVTDLSDLKISEKLKESEENFRSMADNIPNLAWMARSDGYIFWYNSRWYEYTGTNSKQVTGWNWKSIHDPKVLPIVMKKWKASIESGEPFEMVFPLKGIDKVFRPFLTRVVPVRDQNGKVVRWFGTNTDISKQKELERQKDNFLGIASHELKTPVTSIKAYGQVLQTIFKRKGDRKSVELLQKMDSQISKLTNLIGDLLDVTKIQSGRLEFHEDFFDFNALVYEVIEDLQFTSEKHTIVQELAKTTSVYADRERIGQVVTNLITNAIKYSPQSKKVIVKTALTENEITLCVKDFGIGIPEDKQDKVFEQFFRVSGSKQSTFPGLGLGLYVSSEIIKREGGKIWVESTLGKGSVFYFSLKLNKNQIKNMKEKVKIGHK